MRVSTIIATLPLALAAPAARSEPAPLQMRANGIAGKYIVRLKDNSHASAVSSVLSVLNTEPEHIFQNVFNGFAATLDPKTLHDLRNHPDVSKK